MGVLSVVTGDFEPAYHWGAPPCTPRQMACFGWLWSCWWWNYSSPCYWTKSWSPWSAKQSTPSRRKRWLGDGELVGEYNTNGLVIIVLYTNVGKNDETWWNMFMSYFRLFAHPQHCSSEMLGQFSFVATWAKPSPMMKPGALWVLWHLSTVNVDHVSGMVCATV